MVTEQAAETTEQAEATEGPEAATAVEPDPICPACGTPGAPGARFCEECGALMDAAAAPAAQDPAEAAGPPAPPPARPCARCGGRIAADGYCEACGAPAESERDHFAITVSDTVGGVCDRGVVHHRNEDAMALALAGGVELLVVCDGVSTAPSSDVASMAACAAAIELLAEGAPGGSREVTAQGTGRTSAWASLLVEAAARANDAVLAVPVEREGDAPSCTYVAAVVDGDLVVVASVGDSRAYWLPDGGRGVRLSIDDSWAQEMTELGMPASQVEDSPHAHAITRWLGADAPELKPRTDTVTVTSPGWLLLCSDGLWNYCSPADDVKELVRTTAEGLGAGATPTDIAGAMVAWANAQGGRDNVTVVLSRLGEESLLAAGNG